MNQLKTFLLGSEVEEFNFVSKTICGSGRSRPGCFKFMQSIRLFIILINLVIFCIYSYIYVLKGLKEYHFWALFFPLLSFILLFVGSGKELTNYKLA